MINLKVELEPEFKAMKIIFSCKGILCYILQTIIIFISFPVWVTDMA